MSIDAQRRELRALAKTRDLLITAEYVDAVESGKNEHRPGFQNLIRDIKAKGRPWEAVLMLDTSRLARNQYVAHFFKHEAAQHGVEVVFAKTPDLDGITAIILPAVLHAMDEVHSFMSREKGLAGMAENVRQGFRAGGRAPYGYKLEHTATGTVRDGAPVTKSKLVTNGDARKIATYLQGRAAGLPGTSLARDLSLDIARATLTGIEWNALTYAGHTVWNVHNELTREGYKGGNKRRPRSEWIIQRDTHQALITEAEAEAILSRLDNGRAKHYRTKADYLLTGLLITSDGSAWHGNGGKHYRAGKKNINAQTLETAIVEQVAADLASDKFTASLLAKARKASTPHDDRTEIDAAQKHIRALTAKISKLTDLLSETDQPAPLLRKIESLETERDATLGHIDAAAKSAEMADKMRCITERDVRAMLRAMAENMADISREHLKDFLRGLIERITLDTDRAGCCIHYRVRMHSSGELVASPRRCGEIPTLAVKRWVTLPPLRRRAA